ncbi:MAG: single-stranded DNA-binding protein [Bacillota bacterium]|nr:single-stranded DNA-binding protein [Bacillota bacterium]
MNTVVLIGRLTKAPELRQTQSQMAVASFTLAVDRPYNKDKEKSADFLRIVAWGKTAEICEKYLTKGQKVAVQGRIQTGTYEGKDGNRVYTTDIIAERVEFLEGKNKERQDDAPEGFQTLDDDEHIPF